SSDDRRPGQHAHPPGHRDRPAIPAARQGSPVLARHGARRSLRRDSNRDAAPERSGAAAARGTAGPRERGGTPPGASEVSEGMRRRKDSAYSMISVVARQFEVHPQTLRLYEREGLLRPSRPEGNPRLYSDQDLEVLSFILSLTRDLGVNLAGV